MTTYHLYRNTKEFLPGRVSLGEVLPEGAQVIKTIEAADWGKARDTIKEYEFEYKEGYGYF